MKPKIMLAKPITMEMLQEWSQMEWEKKFIERKEDGVRYVRLPQGLWLSRQGHEFHNVEEIQKAINSIRGINNYLVDGELKGDDWSNTITLTRTFRKKVNGSARFRLFDFVKVGNPNEPLYDRKERMAEVFEKLKHPLISVIETQTVSSFKEFHHIFEEHTASGCDGSMIKETSGPYEFKRSKFWLKVKPFVELSCKIIGFNEGKGKYIRSLGSLEVVIPLPGKGKWSKESTSVSGMTDQVRDWLWHNQKKVLGKVVEVRAQAVTKKNRLKEPRIGDETHFKDAD